MRIKLPEASVKALEKNPSMMRGRAKSHAHLNFDDDDLDFEGPETIAHRMRLVVPDEPRKERWDWVRLADARRARSTQQCARMISASIPRICASQVVIILVLYNAVEVPFDLAFSPEPPTWLTIFDYFVDVTFVLE